MSVRTRVAIVGVSGFSGAELARIVADDARFELISAFSDRQRGEQANGVVIRPQSEASSAGKDADIVALATPAEVSAELAPRLLADGARVVDLSGAFRLTDLDRFREYYRFDHPAKELVSEAHYGLPQIPEAAGAAPSILQARLVSNPGCYATAAILALAPFVKASAKDGGLRGPLFVDGKSGVTGAGRKLAERYLFTEVAENVSLYRVVDHQHVPEIELALSRVGGRDLQVTFAPHLLPVRRGLIATCFAHGIVAVDTTQLLKDFYGDSSIVQVRPIDEIDLQSVTGTPRATVGAKADVRGSFVSACAIDNLLKGAASQAHENMCRMVGVQGPNSRPRLKEQGGTSQQGASRARLP